MKLREIDVVSTWIDYAAGRVFYWGTNRIEIIYPGRLSNTGGCDLHDAVFLLNGRTVIGDVEVHIKGSSWYKHGHCKDVRYNDIVLHVVMTDDIHSITRTSNGKYIPLLDIGDLVGRIYSGASIKNTEVKGFKCPAILNSDNRRLLVEHLSMTGMYRFRIKAGNFYRLLKSENPEQILYRSIARCLGYEKNTVPFEKLADNLRIETMKRFKYQTKLLLITFIIGSAGLLPVQTERGSIIASLFSNDEIVEMQRFWIQNGSVQLLSDSDWCFFRIRPANHPIRRLIALGELLYRYGEKGLVNSMSNLILNTSCKQISNIERELMTSAQTGHICFDNHEMMILGKNKVREIIINALLPFMFACGIYTENRELSDKTKKIYGSYPELEDNHLLGYMRKMLAVDTKSNLTSIEQQGMIHIFKNFCRYKDCYRCLLVTRAMSGREQHRGRNIHYYSSGN